jgi:hypothetical protein
MPEEPMLNLRLKRILRRIGVALLLACGLLVVAGAIFAVEVFSRQPVRAVPSTLHASLSRTACIDCHAPIAEEWRQSLHHRSISGPYWQEVRRMGYLQLFNAVRKPCESCHAPAGVLDLGSGAKSASADPGPGIECTPNLLEEPGGVTPIRRLDDVALGIDCVSCHVSAHGILGPGRTSSPVHETIADSRFLDAKLTSETVCRTCHRTTVEVWERTELARRGTTCLDCHMPIVKAASVSGGPVRARRSHRFLGDKDQGMLGGAINASLEITDERAARFRITNDRVGHHLPSGANFLVVELTARDASGMVVAETKRAFGRDEPLLLDFWPFNADRRIEPGGHEELSLSLPDGNGRVEALVRYHDWIKVSRVVATMEKPY